MMIEDEIQLEPLKQARMIFKQSLTNLTADKNVCTELWFSSELRILREIRRFQSALLAQAIDLPFLFRFLKK